MKRTSLLPILGAALTAGFALNAAVPPAEQLLPRDTLAVWTLRDVAATRVLAEKSPANRWWHDPAMTPFRERLVKKFREDVLDQLKAETGLDVEEYAALLQGQVTLAVTRNGWTGGADPLPGVLLLADARDHAPELAAKLADARQRLQEAQAPLGTETVQGVEFSVIRPRPGEAPFSLWFGQSGSLLIVSLNAKPADVEQVVARLNGSSRPCLADEQAWQRDSQALFRDAYLAAWIHATPLLEVLKTKLAEKAAGSDAQSFGPQPGPILEALGIHGLQTLALAARASDRGEGVDLFLGVPADKRKGLFKIPALVRGDASPPPFVSDRVAAFSRARINGAELWQTIESIANEIAPGMLAFGIAQLDASIQQKQPDFSFRRDFIDNLGDDLISWQNPPRENTLEGLGAQPSITLIGSRNAGRMLDTLRTLISTTGSLQLEEREFLGRKIYSLPIPFAEGPQGPMAVHLCANDNYVAVSMDAGILENYLRGADSGARPLASRPGLAAAAEAVGGMRTGFFNYQNDKLVMGSLLETLRAEGDQLLGMILSDVPASEDAPLGLTPQKIRDWFDFSLLPPFEQVSKYFDLTVYAGQVRPEGYLLRFFTPTPPGL
ncbi:MAG: hypothetical protein D6766_02725 [Verrucomicrobia bacterium]|nr:MAG: hypothetical protein D6766_02725 [Verrucomicrobiota bacterium]